MPNSKPTLDSPRSVIVLGHECYITPRGRIVPSIAGGIDPPATATPVPVPVTTPPAAPLEGQPAADPAATPVSTPPPPTFVTQEGLQQFGTQLRDSLMDGFREMTTALAPRPEPVRVDPGPSIEEVQAAIDSGQPIAQVLAKYTQAQVANAIHQLRTTEIDPIKVSGSASITELSLQTIKTRPHYTRFQKEIDASVAGLQRAGQATPANIAMAYSLVIGGHADEIEAEAVERTRREAAAAAAAPPTPTPGTGGRGSVPGTEGTLTFNDVFSPEALSELRKLGKTPETFVKGLGYDTVEAYIEVVREYGNA